MIGLEYVCKLYDIQYKEICNKIGIKPPSLQGWIAKRKIPIDRIEQLYSMEIFKGVPSGYFEKEITDIDRVEICKIYLSYLENKIKNEVAL